MGKRGKPQYYAVKVGRTAGIYRTWAECEAQVKGFPGAKFKGFVVESEAREFIDGGSSAAGGAAQPPAKKRKVEQNKRQIDGQSVPAKGLALFFDGG